MRSMTIITRVDRVNIVQQFDMLFPESVVSIRRSEIYGNWDLSFRDSGPRFCYVPLQGGGTPQFQKSSSFRDPLRPFLALPFRSLSTHIPLLYAMLLKHVLLLTAFVPFVLSSKCSSGNFWFNDKSCCLPYGGPSNPPSPPSDTRCPNVTHYWYKDKSCCAPRQPPSSQPPKCPTNWEWRDKEQCCKLSTNPPPQPSPKSDYKKNRRSVNRVTRCPSGLEACPVSSLSAGYECLDTATELESCGGCATLGKGQDCTTIEGAWNVACERGSCKVYSCEGGYKLDAGNNSCALL